MTKTLDVQLPIAVPDAKPYIVSGNWALSQKLDGHRMLVRCGDRQVVAYNRQGQPRTVPNVIEEYLTKTPHTFIFDGELVGDMYWVFDILEIPTGSVRTYPWVERHELVRTLVNDNMFPNMKYVKHYFTYEEKLAFFQRCKDESAEGVVLTSLVAPYKPGRSEGILKHKFISEVDCVIIDENEGDRSNFVLAVYKDGKEFPCGRVSALTGDGPDLKVGDVCTVECLYSTQSGRLFQPTKPRRRNDKSPEECTFDQIEAIKVNKQVIQ